MVGGLRVLPAWRRGFSKQPRISPGSWASSLNPRLVAKLVADSAAKRGIPSDWQRIRLLTQAELERLLRTARDCQGKGRRPFADLCLTTWLRRRTMQGLNLLGQGL